LPELSEALRAISCRSVILDAELCLLGAGGVPDFYGLSSAMRRGGGLAVYAFDILHRDGKDLWPVPLVERRSRLQRLLARSDVPCLLMVEAFADGASLLELAERHGLEGVVSKRKVSPYHLGRVAVLAQGQGCILAGGEPESVEIVRTGQELAEPLQKLIGTHNHRGCEEAPKEVEA
jgi:ATP-dependent DNA ligase